MIRPLRDRVVVRMDDSIPNAANIFLAPNTKAWREAQDQIANRGTVVSVGEGKRHKKTGCIMPVSCKPGDAIRFSELQYPTLQHNGETFVLIMDADIVGIER